MLKVSDFVKSHSSFLKNQDVQNDIVRKHAFKTSKDVAENM